MDSFGWKYHPPLADVEPSLTDASCIGVSEATRISENSTDQTDSFVQQGNNWADVLWVVDNSCSMEDEQGLLGDDFSYF